MYALGTHTSGRACNPSRLSTCNITRACAVDAPYNSTFLLMRYQIHVGKDAVTMPSRCMPAELSQGAVVNIATPERATHLSISDTSFRQDGWHGLLRK